MNRRRLLLAAKVLVSTGLLAWVIHAAVSREGVDALAAELSAIEPAWLLVAVAFQLGAVGAGVVRWRMLLRARGLELPLAWLARSYLVGRFVGTFTPSTAGLDVYRAVDVARRTGDRAGAASVIVVEKLLGLLGLTVLCVVLLPAGGARFFGPGAVTIAAAVGAGSAAGLWLVARPERAAPVLRVVPSALRGRADRLLSALGTRGLDRSVLVPALALGVVGHLLTAAVFVGTALALGVDASPLGVLVVGASIVVATLVPISIGGVGVREGVAVMLLGAVSVGATEATLVALAGYLVGQVPGVLGGLVSLTPPGTGAAEARRAPPAPGIPEITG